MKKSTKDVLGMGTCVAAFLIGFGLTIAGFIVPPVGVVSDSVLWVLGQSLLYCGACIGINEHYSSRVKAFEDEIKKQLQDNKSDK